MVDITPLWCQYRKEHRKNAQKKAQAYIMPVRVFGVHQEDHQQHSVQDQVRSPLVHVICNRHQDGGGQRSCGG